MSMRPIVKNILDDISGVLSGINIEQYEQMVHTLAKADRIFVAGAGRSLLMMKAMAIRLMHIGKTVYVVGETITPSAGCNDILIVGTGSGETHTMKAIAEKAKIAKVSLLVITTNDNSTLAQQADKLLVIPASVNHLNPNEISWQPGGNSFEQSLLILGDAITMDVAKETGEDISGRLVRHANLE